MSKGSAGDKGSGAVAVGDLEPAETVGVATGALAEGAVLLIRASERERGSERSLRSERGWTVQRVGDLEPHETEGVASVAWGGRSER